MFRTISSTTERPAPQPMSHGELLSVLDLLKKAGMAGDETYTKFEILARYAGKRTMETGRAYIAISAE